MPISDLTQQTTMPVLSYTPRSTLEAEVGIGHFSTRLRAKNAHFSERINLNLLNQTKPILTRLVSVLVSAAVLPAFPALQRETRGCLDWWYGRWIPLVIGCIVGLF